MDDQAFDVWRERREREGSRVTLVDLYRMVAAARGVGVADLSVRERRELWERASYPDWKRNRSSTSR